MVRRVRIEELESTGVSSWFAPGNGGCGGGFCGCCKGN
jgi:hypothetical protein